MPTAAALYRRTNYLTLGTGSRFRAEYLCSNGCGRDVSVENRGRSVHQSQKHRSNWKRIETSDDMTNTSKHPSPSIWVEYESKTFWGFVSKSVRCPAIVHQHCIDDIKVAYVFVTNTEAYRALYRFDGPTPWFCSSFASSDFEKLNKAKRPPRIELNDCRNRHGFRDRGERSTFWNIDEGAERSRTVNGEAFEITLPDGVISSTRVRYAFVNIFGEISRKNRKGSS